MADFTTTTSRQQRIPVWAVAGIALVVTMITTRPLQTRAFLVPRHHETRPAMAQATASSAPAFVSSPNTATTRGNNGIGGGSGASTNTALLMTEEPQAAQPTTFREAEVLGLKLMQEGNYEDALKGEGAFGASDTPI